MKKEIIWKILLAAAVLLVVGFAASLGADYHRYTTSLNSAPFSLTVVIRIIEFGIPAAAALAAGIIFKKKGS